MKLKHPFSTQVRNLFFDIKDSCARCKTNGKGTLELHHIYGRVSGSPYNAVVLCKECHAEANHNNNEEAYYSGYARIFVEMQIRQHNYKLQERDLDFICKYYPPTLVTEMVAEAEASGVPYPTDMCVQKYTEGGYIGANDRVGE